MNAVLNRIQNDQHSHCFVCGCCNELGFKLDFMAAGDGSVEGVVNCSKHFQSYENILHGGMISTLLDGAMTNCLFAHGITALTAELKVRFRYPVLTNKDVTLRAWIEKQSSLLYYLKAELIQEDKTKASATAKFVKKD